MSDRPLLFISAVSAEHRSLRGTVAALLDHEGYDTDFQEVLGTEHGDITSMLARHVDQCDGVIQLVGQRYGFAPSVPHPQFGACSYTQFEALYARSIGKPVRYILLDPAHPSDADPAKPEAPERQALQAAYRQRIQADTALYHPSKSIAETENSIYRLRPVLEELRREWRARMERQERVLRRLRPLPIIAGVTLAALVAVGGWFFLREREHSKKQDELTKGQDATATKLDNIDRKLDTKLDLMERELAVLARELRERGKTLADFTPDQVLAELAARQKTTPEELELVLEAALTSDDRSVRAQALMVKQHFPEAAKLSREAGDAKVERLKAMKVRTAALAEEAALDYRREGLAYEYQLQYQSAIFADETALEIVSRTSHPETWAMLQNDLAIALSQHGIRTDPATGNQLLMRAVAAFRAALEVRTREALPQDWARIQNNLAVTLSRLGQRSIGQAGLDLLGQAATVYRAALEVYTREALPLEWAMTQNNLGSALEQQAIRSEKQAGLALLGQAVAAYRAALEVHTREALPQDWAMTQNNLANALGYLGNHSEGTAGLELLKQAVTTLRDVLEVHTRVALPQHWAATQNDLAVALSRLGERSEAQVGLELLGQAVAAYRAVIDVRTRVALPQDWAMTQHNLASALMAQGDKTQAAHERSRLYGEAEAAYLGALEVWTKEASPHYHLQTQQNLARLRAKMAGK